MNTANIINDGMIEAMMRAALFEEVVNEVESAPSDAELIEMFPETKKDKRFLRRYEKREQRREKRLREPAPAAFYLKRAAVVLMVAVSVFTALMMTSTEVRAAVEHTVIEFFDKYAKINFSHSENEGDEDADDIYKLKIGYIPDGYELIEADETEENRWYTYYRSDNDSYLSIDFNKTDSSELDVDTELYDVTEISIGRYSGYLFYYEEEQEGTLIYGNKQISVKIDADLCKDELIKIAENIK